MLGLADGTPEENLGEKYLPEGGYALADAMGENGVQRIARQLSEAEQAVKDQLEGHDRAASGRRLPAYTRTVGIMILTEKIESSV